MLESIWQLFTEGEPPACPGESPNLLLLTYTDTDLEY